MRKSSWFNEPQGTHDWRAFFVMSFFWNLDGSLWCFDRTQIVLAPIDNTIRQLGMLIGYRNGAAHEHECCKYNSGFHLFSSRLAAIASHSGWRRRVSSLAPASHVLIMYRKPATKSVEEVTKVRIAKNS